MSIFALNLATAMGLALAIDYTLLIVSRYRDELDGGAGRTEAVARTLATAGRTVLFSATTVALSMSVMVLFPMHFLKSFAYAGVATVAFAAAAAVVVTPAALVLLGDRLGSLDVRRFARRLLRRPDPQPVPVEERFWYRCATTVMRRALPLGLAVVALLLLAGAPFLGVRWGFPDDRVLPGSASAHQVGDQLRRDFADNTDTAVTVVIPDAAWADGGRAVPLRRRPVACPRRSRGVRADRHVRRRRRGRTAVGARRRARRQRVSDRHQHRAAVLRCLRGTAGPPARGRRPRGPRRRW